MYTAKEARSLSEQNLKLRNEEILNIILENTNWIISINMAIKEAINSGKTGILFSIENRDVEIIKETYFDNYTDISCQLIVNYGVGAYYNNLGYKVIMTEIPKSCFKLRITW